VHQGAANTMTGEGAEYFTPLRLGVIVGSMLSGVTG
jgi:hypothetical protein